MQWSLLDHSGPTIVRLSEKLNEDYGVLYENTKSKKQVNLNNTQRYLLLMYYDKYYLKVDSVFQANFWKSLRSSSNIVSDKQVVIRCPLSKRPGRFFDIERSTVCMTDDKGTVRQIAGTFDSHPSIFVGRDPFHPKRGTCRWSVPPRDVTLNMTLSESNIERAKRRGFTKLVENKSVRWFACWKDPVTLETRYLTVKPTDSSVDKFDKARMLKRSLKRLHHKVFVDITSPNDTLRETALAVYFIEHLCIRVGNEKDVLHEADTIGCCTLKAHTNIHIKNRPKKMICVTFVGKDSVPFKKSFVLPTIFYDQCERMLNSRDPQTLFFSKHVSPSSINRYIHSIAPGCSAKTFRTLKASLLFQRCLKKTNDVRQANAKVALLLNHRKGPKKDKLNMETSRKNYIDPRVYIAHCKRNHVQPRRGWLPDTNCTLVEHTDASFVF